MTHDDDPVDLSSLARESAPPPGVEEAVVAALLRSGQLRRKARWPRLTLGVAAAFVLFGLGLAAGRLLPRRAGAPAAGYALLLYRGAEAETSPQEGERRVGEVIGWVRSVRASGRSLTGEKLAPGERKIGASDVASSGASELQGFFLLQAKSLAEAEEVARDCPHLRYGGVIVVRPLEKT